jgi:peptidoglycan-associated lipoprotein
MNIRNSLTLLFMGSFILNFMGCKVSEKEANSNYQDHSYLVAADMYKKLSKEPEATKEQKQEWNYRIGEAYRFNHDSKNALKYYAKAIRYGMKDPVVYYREAEMMMEQGNYTEAISKFKAYKKMNPSDPDVDKKIKGCELALECADKKTRYVIESFKVVNESKADDRVPRYADKRKKSIMFTSNRELGLNKRNDPWTGDRYFEDVWITELKGGRRGRAAKWTKPELIETFTEVNEGAMTFDSRYSTMYITQCGGLDGYRKNVDTTCKIYMARKSGQGWEIQKEPLPFCKEGYNYGHPALSPDGKKLYFASDQPGGMSDDREGMERTKDLWVASYVKRGRTWGDPVNLGPTINTKGNELFPFVHDDGTLYFSSDGHVTLGGLDILHTQPLSSSPTDWQEPINMGCPMNSQNDDFGILVDEGKESGYFTSDRAKPGDDDIYQFSMTPLVILLKGTVTDCDSKLPLKDALVVISNNQDSSKIRLRTDEQGFYETPLKPGVKYEVMASKRSDYYYDSKPKQLSTEGIDQSTEFVKDFCLKNQCDDIFVLPIYYDLDKAFLRPESKKVLDDLVAQLEKYPKMQVELGSHTDCRASFEYNRYLSQRRADSAVAYLFARGINPFRVEAMGYGESMLTNKCECEGANVVPCTEDEHQENRRTTVKVVNCKYEFKWTEITAPDTNQAALEGGAIVSKYVLKARAEYYEKYKGKIKEEIKAIEKEKERQKAIADSIAFAKMYDIIPVSESRGKYYVRGVIGKKKLKMQYIPEGTSRIELPQNVVEQLLRQGIVKVDDFKDGREKIKLTDGTKLSSRSFKVPELEINGIVFKDVRAKMVDGNEVKIGEGVFAKEYESVELKGDKLLLKKEQEDQ